MRPVVLDANVFIAAAEATDALYAAAAELTGGVLVSWDGEQRSRAGALTPTEWMAANSK